MYKITLTGCKIKKRSLSFEFCPRAKKFFAPLTVSDSAECI